VRECIWREAAKLPSGDPVIDVTVRGRGGWLFERPWAHTLSLEAACVVRFLLVMVPGREGAKRAGADWTGHDVNLVSNPPKNIPTLRRVIEHYASLAQTYNKVSSFGCFIVVVFGFESGLPHDRAPIH
jgi:hypothetical protein